MSDGVFSQGYYKAIWDRLTEKEREVTCAIAHSDSMTVKEIREALSMESNQFSPYRENLKESGLINTSDYGKIAFTLPRFREFVLRMEKYTT